MAAALSDFEASITEVETIDPKSEGYAKKYQDLLTEMRHVEDDFVSAQNVLVDMRDDPSVESTSEFEAQAARVEALEQQLKQARSRIGNLPYAKPE